MNAELLLVQAEQELARGAVNRNRIACWFARAALEDAIRDALESRSLNPGGASMRSQLSCLEIATADQPDLAQQAEYLWVSLSNACHQHAYQLGPTAMEAADYVAKVRLLHSRVCEMRRRGIAGH